MVNIRKRKALLLIGVALLPATAVAQTPVDTAASRTDPAPTTPARPSDDSETVVVTGSRLSGIDPTSDVKIYSADDIQALGVSNLQDFFRTLPQNQASVGTGLNNRSSTEVAFDQGALGGLGVAGVNLRGLGTRNTLVLVNGRRVAGAAGIEEGFVNINTIPLAAVDRIEISLGGSGAVYGADALGGVVNIILKKNYHGLSANGRLETSSSGAANRQSSLTAGTGWRGGSLTLTGSVSTTDPVLNRRIGYVTHDYRRYFTREQLSALGRTKMNLDFRSGLDSAQPGAINIQYLTPKTRHPNGTTTVNYFLQYHGKGAWPLAKNDFGGVDNDTIALNIPREAAEYNRTYGLSARLEQAITDRLRFTLDYAGSRSHYHLSETWDKLVLEGLPPEQAYSPVHRADLPPDATNYGAAVYYFPAAEYADGRQRPGFTRSWIQSDGVTAGLSYHLGKNTELTGNFSYSQNRARGSQLGWVQAVKINGDTGACVGVQSEKVTPHIEQVVARQCAALTSPDPALAFNFNNDGTQHGGAPLSTFFLPQAYLSDISWQTSADVLFTAAPLRLPAGLVQVSLGAETYDNGVRAQRIRAQTGEDVNSRVIAGYAELRVPLVGTRMAVPLVSTLDASFKARYDRFDSTGPIGTVDHVPPEQHGTLIRGTSTFARISPGVGLAWAPVQGLTLRGSWGSTFSPPDFTQLYDIHAGVPDSEFIFADPLSPDWDYDFGREIPKTYLANPQLRPSVSSTYEASLNIAPSGVLNHFILNVDYYKTTIRDEIDISSHLRDLLPPKEYYGLKEFFVRDAGGFLQAEYFKPINVGRALSESVDVDVSYTVRTHVAAITPSLSWSRVLRQEYTYHQRVLRAQVGTANGLDRFRLNGALDVTSHRWFVRLSAHYLPSYINNYGMAYEDGHFNDQDSDGQIDRPMPVHSLTTYDLTARWRLSPATTFSVGGRNIFHAKAPFALIDRRPFDASRYDLRGRVLYCEARLEF
ncbi:iron complex outermembrane receptor protein [Sphingomonas sp. BK235]|nr:iron complex outermembrane receptor protein [Sphingomonas sp. BK235]